MVNSFLKQYLVYFIPFYVSRHVCPDTWGAPHLPNCPHGSLSPLSCPCLPLIFHTSWKPYIRPSSTYGPSSSKSVAYSISFLKESLKVLVSWEPVSSLRTFSSMKSCQMMALFLPQTSHHVSCMYKVSISFHGCFLSFFLIFPKKPNYKPCVIVIVQPPVIPPNFCVDLSSWLIIIIFSSSGLILWWYQNPPRQLFQLIGSRSLGFLSSKNLLCPASLLQRLHILSLCTSWFLIITSYLYNSISSVLLGPLVYWSYHLFCSLYLWCPLFPPWSVILVAPLHVISLSFSCIIILTWRCESPVNSCSSSILPCFLAAWCVWRKSFHHAASL